MDITCICWVSLNSLQQAIHRLSVHLAIDWHCCQKIQNLVCQKTRWIVETQAQRRAFWFVHCDPSETRDRVKESNPIPTISLPILYHFLQSPKLLHSSCNCFMISPEWPVSKGTFPFPLPSLHLGIPLKSYFYGFLYAVDCGNSSPRDPIMQQCCSLAMTMTARLIFGKMATTSQTGLLIMGFVEQNPYNVKHREFR